MQESTYRPNMTSHAAHTASSSLHSSLHIRTMSAGRSSSACYRYGRLSPAQSSPWLTRTEQEDSPDTLHLIVAFLLYDGRQNEVTFEMMNEEGVFARLLELILERTDDDAGLHRMLLELLYEMSRIQRLRMEDLSE